MTQKSSLHCIILLIPSMVLAVLWSKALVMQTNARYLYVLNSVKTWSTKLSIHLFWVINLILYKEEIQGFLIDKSPVLTRINSQKRKQISFWDLYWDMYTSFSIWQCLCHIANFIIRILFMSFSKQNLRKPFRSLRSN